MGKRIITMKYSLLITTACLLFTATLPALAQDATDSPAASEATAATPAVSSQDTDGQGSYSQSNYGLALYGELKYGPGFTHFDYVNPNAPKGGTVKLAESGHFDSVHPFLLKGVKAPGLGQMFDTLMVQSQDEPQSMYGLIAKSVSVAPDNSYADFTVNPDARFHDGQPDHS
jgi:microcin C transport system substrate-binding protein